MLVVIYKRKQTVGFNEKQEVKVFFPEKINSESELEELLSYPMPEVVELMKRLEGDIMILGIAGKMGITLGRQAVEAIKLAKVEKKVYGVARFSNPESRTQLEEYGIETIKCDLLNQQEVNALQVANVLFMAGRKFGTDGSEALTWAMNAVTPEYVASHFRDSKIVVFSTGCVYPLIAPTSVGCTEEDAANPVGEYAQSCLGRERIFQYNAQKYGTKMVMYRLNYAIDMRYGVLHDIAKLIWEDQPVSLSVSHFNVLWQGDANAYALLALEMADNPVQYLNVTGPEIISVEFIAEAFGKLFNKEIKYVGEPSSKCYLNNASKCFHHYGYPHVSLQWMIDRTAEWFLAGGGSLGKPTHFEVNDGKF